MFNFATVVFNLIEEVEVKMRSQEFNSIDIYQLKTDLERAAITLKRLPRNYLDKPTGIALFRLSRGRNSGVKRQMGEACRRSGDRANEISDLIKEDLLYDNSTFESPAF
jgi:hypothetical protein